MSEPQPHDAGDVEPNAAPAASAEDRKAAAALSALDERGDDDAAAAAGKSDVDAAALGAAMNRLEMLDKKGTAAAAPAANTNKNGDGAKKEAVPAKKVKVEAADVALLVEQLEMSKGRATELLRANEGKLETALEAWIKV